MTDVLTQILCVSVESAICYVSTTLPDNSSLRVLT